METRLPERRARFAVERAMSGWRDADGRTAADRKKSQRNEDRARLAETVRNRPLSLVRPVLSALFVGILVVALLNFFT